MIISIVLFFFITLGLGSVTYCAGWRDEDLAEKLILTQATGLLLIPVIAVLFNCIGIALDYKNFILLACGIILTHLVRAYVKKEINKKAFRKIAASLQSLPLITYCALFLIFVLSLWMYLKGSFSYSWFEDGDPWRYAAAIKFIEVNKTYSAPFHFIEIAQPYPQGYQIIMAIMSQINHSLNWTVKFFNCLIISLSLLYSFCAIRKFVNDTRAALLATAALASMPAWLSHFIFAINLSTAMLPIFLYILTMIDTNKRWAILGAAAFASIWLTHFSSAVVITVLFAAYYYTKVFCENNLRRALAIAGSGGFVLSLAYWIPSLKKFNTEPPGGIYIIMPLIKKILFQPLWTTAFLGAILLCILVFVTEKWWSAKISLGITKLNIKNIKPKIFLLILIAVLAFLLYPEKFMALRGSGSMAYTLNHFFLFHKIPNLIQNPFGIGPSAMVLCIIALGYLVFKIKTIFNSKQNYGAIAFVLWIVTFLGVNGAHFSINLMPFRMWSFFAFSTALLIGFFYCFFIKRIHSNKIKHAFVIFLIASFIPTWFNTKALLNIKPWRENYIGVTQGQDFFAWAKENIPKNSKVYAFGVSQAIPIAYDMISFIWDKEINDYVLQDTLRSIEHNYQFLKSKRYEYIIIDEALSFSHTVNRTYSMAPKSELAKILILTRARTQQIIEAHDKFKLIKKIGNSGGLFKIL